MSDQEEQFFRAEVTRAVHEVRQTISRLIIDMKSTSWIGRIGTLLDKVEVDVICEDGDSAFELDEETSKVFFRVPVMAKIWAEVGLFTDTISDDPQMVRERQLAINQFVFHELLHIRQNFPHFATVDNVKKGLPGYGLPLLDIAADVASAWMTAQIEVDRTGEDQDQHHKYYINALLRAYVIGAYVFDARSKPEKRQRALGLLISAALTHGLHSGVLNEENIFDGWAPDKPVFCLNLTRLDTFNAFVLDGIPGLLVDKVVTFERESLDLLWDMVGKSPVAEAFTEVIKFLIAIDALARPEDE